MPDKIRVPEMSGEQARILRLLSPDEKLSILLNAALSKKKSLAHSEQVDFNGNTYAVYPMERLDLALQAMSDGKPVLVLRECVACHAPMYDSPVRRYQWSDACEPCSKGLIEE